MEVGNRRITYRHKSPEAPHGRFGGGWQWKVGIQANRNFSSVIVSLLVCSIRIERVRDRVMH